MLHASVGLPHEHVTRSALARYKHATAVNVLLLWPFEGPNVQSPDLNLNVAAKVRCITGSPYTGASDSVRTRNSIDGPCH